MNLVIIDSESDQAEMQTLHDNVANLTSSSELWTSLTRYRFNQRDDDTDARHLVWYNTQGCTDCAMDEEASKLCLYVIYTGLYVIPISQIVQIKKSSYHICSKFAKI